MKRRFLFMLMAALTCFGANAAINRANNYLEASEATATAGKTVVVNILMTNNFNIANWQTNLILPDGITLVSAEAAEKWVDPVNVEGNQISTETENPVAAGSKAVVAKVTLQVASTVAAGEYEIALSSTVMIADNSTIVTQVDNKVAKLTVEEGHAIEGDLTGDSEVNAADIQAMLNLIASGENNPAADLTNDGEINAGDIQALLNIIAAQ
jgi:cytoskeletal protein CcmA (bactofilin family)